MKTTRRHVYAGLLSAPLLVTLLAGCVKKHTASVEELNERHPGKLTYQKSEATQALSVSLTEMRVYTNEPSELDDSGRRVLSLLFTGIQGAEVANLSIFVESRGKDYSTCHAIELTADGAPITPVTAPIYDTEERASGFLEIVIAELPTAALTELLRAKGVKARLCKTELTFSEAQIAVIKEFAKALTDLANLTEAPH